MGGNRLRIPDYRLVGQDKIDYAIYFVESFHRTTTPTALNNVAARRDIVFEILRSRRRYTLAFCSEHEDPRGPTYGQGLQPFATTCLNAQHMQDQPANHPGWRIFTFMNLRRLAQLRQNDLNVSERMSLEWNVANTVDSSPLMFSL